MAENTKNTILETSNLDIGYSIKKENQTIATNINLKLNKNELIGLVGGNGIGKSTLLRTLTKVQKPLSGVIYINKKPIENYTNLELAKALSLVLTESLTSKNLTVFELVALGRQPYTNWIGNLSEKDKTITENAILQTNIETLKHKKYFELSDGQQQIVMIARALAQDTNIIILDEPTTHLDMYHKAFILKLLQKLVKETGKTILFSSHEINLAIPLCDTMIVMTKNNVISNTPKKLIENGDFESLFPKDLITFNSSTSSFKVKD